MTTNGHHQHIYVSTHTRLQRWTANNNTINQHHLASNHRNPTTTTTTSRMDKCDSRHIWHVSSSGKLFFIFLNFPTNLFIPRLHVQQTFPPVGLKHVSSSCKLFFICSKFTNNVYQQIDYVYDHCHFNVLWVIPYIYSKFTNNVYQWPPHLRTQWTVKRESEWKGRGRRWRQVHSTMEGPTKGSVDVLRLQVSSIFYTSRLLITVI